MRELSGDATSVLLRALGRRLGAAEWRIENLASDEWASVTFTGARHAVTLILGGADAAANADRFLDGLEAAEFRLRGHILADIALVQREDGMESVRLRIEALTVEES
ncbi:hypothetical protein [Allosphingosinicella indica]|uniref:DUF3168 domain-containing protein n=1 Tax=Allosphingosinicella indica TaxID=941907 RepID=A0A1X7G057_9SPHN|nr:hypothetical protein [Allosphingosinicella indica]SMF61760.1 hypothetical protein SAMN06295910_0753 [Allosphingosinicella indica]